MSAVFVDTTNGETEWKDIEIRVCVNSRGGWTIGAHLADFIRGIPGEAAHEVTIHARVPIPKGRKWDVDATIRVNRGVSGYETKTELADIEDDE